MSDSQELKSSDPSSSGTAVASCVWLTLALLVVFPAFAWFGYSRSGTTGVLAAAIAAGVCWFGAMVALSLIAITRGTPAAIQATLLGTFARMGLPLLAGFVLQQSHGALAQAGVFGMILCYYFVALFVETLLSVRLLGGTRTTMAKA